MNLELIDKTALISGSTKGIGFAIASQLAAEGARVIVNGRSENAVSSALEQVRKAVHKPKVEGWSLGPGRAAWFDSKIKPIRSRRTTGKLRGRARRRSTRRGSRRDSRR